MGYLIFGILASGIPIILHLVYRRRAPRVLFSTLRFIRLSVEQTARRRKIRELLLLLLRIGAILFLALALSEMLSFSSGLGDGRGVSVAVVMDNSYSMSAEFNNVAHYGRAQENATKILRDAARGGKAALLYAQPPPQGREHDTLTTDVTRLADEIQASQVSLVPRGDLAGALQRAEEALVKAPVSERGEIYIFTDMQRLAWRRPPPVTAEKAAPVIIVDCAGTCGENLAVTDIRVVTVRPAVGVPVTVDVEVQNFSPSKKDAPINFYVGRQKRAERTVPVEANSVATVSFSHKIESAGTHTGWVDLTDIRDAVAMDNRRHFAFNVPENIRVAVVREKKGALPLLDEAYFITPALNPAFGTQGSLSTIQPAVLLRDQLTQTRLSDFDVVFLLNLPELTTDQLDALKAYLRNGGAVVVFVGDNVKADAWNGYTDPVEGALLPARLGKLLVADEQTGEQVTVAKVDEDHPMFLPLKDMQRTFFTRVRLWRYLELEVEENSGARVLSTLSNGHPFLLEKETAGGRGKVLLFCTTATNAWTNLPARNFYLSMLHQMVYYLAQTQDRAADYIAGHTIIFPSVEGRTPEVQVTNPRNTITRAKIIPDRHEAAYTNTKFVGPYYWQDAGDPTRSGVFTINIESSESNLATISDNELAEDLLKDRKVYFARDADSALAVAAKLRSGFSLRNPLLFLVIAILIAECLLANRARAKIPRATGLPGMLRQARP